VDNHRQRAGVRCSPRHAANGADTDGDIRMSTARGAIPRLRARWHAGVVGDTRCARHGLAGVWRDVAGGGLEHEKRRGEGGGVPPPPAGSALQRRIRRARRQAGPYIRASNVQDPQAWPFLRQ
jgi:hypothetical protein